MKWSLNQGRVNAIIERKVMKVVTDGRDLETSKWMIGNQGRVHIRLIEGILAVMMRWMSQMMSTHTHNQHINILPILISIFLFILTNWPSHAWNMKDNETREALQVQTNKYGV